MHLITDTEGSKPVTVNKIINITNHQGTEDDITTIYMGLSDLKLS